MKKVLVITYYWPPGGGAGVQRWLKFTRYLPEYGWEPVILTVDPKYAQYPASDNTLAGDIPEGIKIFSTPATNYFRMAGAGKSKIPSAGFANREKRGLVDLLMRFIRGNFFIPDPRKGWNRHALKKAKEIIGELGINTLITSSPPHSTQLIGLKLKKCFPGLKWIADFRDPWTDIYYYKEFLHTPPARYLDRMFEKRVITAADRIITVGESLKQILASKVKGSSPRISVVTNGYDEEDFSQRKHEIPEVFTITYAGTVSPHYPLEGFTEAVKNILADGGTVKLRFTGMVSGDQKERILHRLASSSVEFIPYVSHHEAVKLMLSSSALLLVIPDYKQNDCIITGKLYEYLAAGRPVILVGPVTGDASAILESSGAGKTFGYADSDGMRVFIKQMIKGDFKPAGRGIEKYSRKNLTRDLSKILSEVAG